MFVSLSFPLLQLLLPLLGRHANKAGANLLGWGKIYFADAVCLQAEIDKSVHDDTKQQLYLI